MHIRCSPTRGIIHLEPAAELGDFGLDERLELKDCAAGERRVECRAPCLVDTGVNDAEDGFGEAKELVEAVVFQEGSSHAVDLSGLSELEDLDLHVALQAGFYVLQTSW